MTIQNIFSIIDKELNRQQNHIELIASENIVSKDVLKAVGSVLTNKYAEGYPGKRYYAGCEFVDEIENIAIENLKKLFNVNFANVQPNSGSQANQAVFLAFLQPGDKVLGMSLDTGGHLTHGLNKNLSGMWFNFFHYGVRKDTYEIDYDQLEEIALREKPKMIIAGFSAYTRKIDWERFSKIAKSINAILFADIAHVAGLIASGLYPSPVEFADIITSTTHKTLRGPRGGIIMTNNEEYAKKINSAVFPGLQGGPLMHVIAGKAVAFEEALQPEFREYSKQVIKNAKIMANRFIENKIDILTDGTDNHMVILNLEKFENINGAIISKELEKLNIICNKNMIPFDKLPPVKTSGIRLGTPACTTRGFKENEFIKVADIISKVIYERNLNEIIPQNSINYYLDGVSSLVKQFPIY